MENQKPIDGALIEPTDVERRNGWTAETLTVYVRQQQTAQAEAIDPSKRTPRRASAANSKYDPHRCWG